MPWTGAHWCTLVHELRTLTTQTTNASVRHRLVCHILISFMFIEYIPGQSYLPIVKTVYGIMQGQTVVGEDGRYSHEYLGIPYAKPPLGKLRFQKPEPFTGNWAGICQ